MWEHAGHATETAEEDDVWDTAEQSEAGWQEGTQTEAGQEPGSIEQAKGERASIRCINEELAGRENPETGVPYERRSVELDGREYDVVVPRFESRYDAVLEKDLYEESDYRQKKECNRQLREGLGQDPALAKSFTAGQREQIDSLDTPDGYTWHHDATPGGMQLVDSQTHAATRHTGGRTLWGGGREMR